METLKNILQGTWFGHPLHPALVHIPTGLWPAALLCDILSMIWPPWNEMVRLSFWAIAVGLIMVLLAVPTGLADWWDIKKQRRAYTLGVYHMILNIAVAVLMLVSLILRIPHMQADAVPGWPLFFSLTGVLLLFVAGYLGGLMVYDRGVSVARMSKDRWRKLAKAGGANVPEEDG